MRRPSAMIRFILVQLGLGALLGNLLLAALAVQAGPLAASLAEEALRQPCQLLAIWIGATAPFAVGFLGTALCLRGGFPGGVGPGAARVLQPALVRSDPVRHLS